MTKGIIYYTNNNLSEPIFTACQNQLKLAIAGSDPAISITSVSLSPINFGKNIVAKGESGYLSMVNQIITALETSSANYVFFCEHDVLYHPSHFEFTPSTDDTYYYNMNNWRWDYPRNRLIRYDGLTSLSELCVNREFALKHYHLRLKKMKEVGLESFQMKDPHMARLWGYEPGLKKKRNGALIEEKSDNWNSLYPNIDIRHQKTFSLPKVSLKDFKHKPTGWQETTTDKVDGWNLGKLFNLNQS